ncbi:MULTISPECIES: HPP family protein [unclassified Streptomyces]|uniref:HPP family protein n=1 Tax=unclassified Streptomyces TaxID=2593676 RepID=UPI00278BE6B0|nr:MULTISPECIES: HPP family protein [unclassified Streptomyces]
MADTPVADLPASRRSTVLTSRAPARAAAPFIGIATLGGVVALTLLVALGSALDQTVLIPPLAASAALVFAAPALPLAQPRSVIGGQLISAVVGFLVLPLGGSSFWSAAVAGGLAIGAMALARTPHSPAAATSVIVVLSEPDTVLFLSLLLLGTVVLVAVGIAAGRTGKTARYPTYWW